MGTNSRRRFVSSDLKDEKETVRQSARGRPFELKEQKAQSC